MLGLMGFSGSLPLYVIHRYYIFVFIDRANNDACLLVVGMKRAISLRSIVQFCLAWQLVVRLQLSFMYSHKLRNNAFKRLLSKTDLSEYLKYDV